MAEGKSNRWAAVKRIGVIVGGLLVGVVALTQIYDWVSGRLSGGLVASLSYGPVWYPGAILETLIDSNTDAERDNLESLLTQYSGYLLVVVTNETRQEMENVKVLFPRLSYVEVARESQMLVRTSPVRFMDVGTLQPQETVVVTAWTDHTPSDQEGESIRLTHSSGVGKVKMRTRGPTRLFYWSTYLISGLALFISLFVVRRQSATGKS